MNLHCSMELSSRLGIHTPSNGGETPCGAESHDKLLCNCGCRYSSGWHLRCSPIFPGWERHVAFSVSMIPCSSIDSLHLFQLRGRASWCTSALVAWLSSHSWPN